VPYEPRKGDIVQLFFEVRRGTEQHGWRPALVISNDRFNSATGMAIVCPITRSDRGYPFHVAVESSSNVEGRIMVDQIRSVDFSARRARRIGTAPGTLVDEVLAILDACLY
jgi:mRNA interferase MazF